MKVHLYAAVWGQHGTQGAAATQPFSNVGAIFTTTQKD